MVKLTKRCATWIFGLMKFKMPTAAIADFFGIHWNTVRKLEQMKINYIAKFGCQKLKRLDGAWLHTRNFDQRRQA